MDLLAGITVAVVALPLALAFGVTAGLTGRAGLITAIIAGIVAAFFGGSDVQVSGPTGAMTVVLVPIVARYGPDGVLVVGLLAGLILIAAALLRLGRAVSYMPWPVIEGFTVGIAVIIFLQQVPSFLGVAKPHGENAATVAVRATLDVANASPGALIVALVVIAIMVVGPRLWRTLPASLIAVTAGTLVAHVAGLRVPTIRAIPAAFPMPRLPDVSGALVQQLLGPALAVAALAAIESLLSAKVADGMADGRAHDSDRELFGQGLANVISPLFGGMPATGAIARTAVNVRAGARSRLSAITHGAVLVLAVLFLGRTLQLIPMAALAGVLMVTAVRMIDLHAVRMLLRSTRGDAAVLAITGLATIAFDLVIAIEIGVLVAGGLALRAVATTTSFEPEPLKATPVTTHDEERLLHEHIVAYRLDGAQALGNIAEELEARGITVLLSDARARHAQLMGAVGTLGGLATENHIFPTLDEAIEHAHIHVAGSQAHPAPSPLP